VVDEDAFLRAVIADPDDDAPRLIYADWLDEHGQGARAEFIRVQIALARMSTRDERRRRFLSRQRRLLRRYGETWAEPLRSLFWNYQFHRGFVESAICSNAREFLRRGEELFALAPIRDLFLSRARHCAQELSQCSYFSRLLSLGLCSSWLGDRDVFYLANSPFLRPLSHLNLADNRITGRGAMYLARSPYLGSLDDLDLRFNTIPREARSELRRRFGTRVHF
jgi:uncharacterized protein (TIGR02996 family)